jgi:TRAP-type C4-dicarboxylate transport system substrate-binding protein
MKTNTLERIMELWPSLPETTRAAIVDIAERASPSDADLELTPEEERLIEQAQDDFKHGRTLTLDQFNADMDAFIADQRRKVGQSANRKRLKPADVEW